MKHIHWRIILEPVKEKRTAEEIASAVCAMIPSTTLASLEEYSKFDHAWSFDMTTELVGLTFTDAVMTTIRLSSSIANSWLQTFYEEDQVFELIFNRSDVSRYSDQKLSVIRWMHAELAS